MNLVILSLALLVLSGCSFSSGLYSTAGKEYGFTHKSCIDSFDVTESLKNKNICLNTNTSISIEASR